jgi:hypothetical protein
VLADLETFEYSWEVRAKFKDEDDPPLRGRSVIGMGSQPERVDPIQEPPYE